MLHRIKHNRISTNDAQGMIWSVIFFVCFSVLPSYLLEGTEEKHDRPLSCRNTNRVLYKTSLERSSTAGCQVIVRGSSRTGFPFGA